MNESHAIIDAGPSALFVEQFPGAADKVYLNSCARGLLPLSAKLAVDTLLEDRVDGSTDKEGSFASVERARSSFANLINASPDEVAITKNVSEGLSLIAGAVDWRAGDNVVVCLDIEHPNNVYPWFNIRERMGVEVRDIPSRAGHIPSDKLIAAIDDRTRLVSLSTVSFSPGFRTDVASVGEVCRERGVLLLADGVQSAGILHTDVEALGVDAFAVSTQKGLLGLYGFGFLFCRQAWAERLHPVSLARFGVDLGDAHEAATGGGQYRLMPGARRFDLGNYNYPGAAAAAAALDLLNDVGTPAIETHVTELSVRLVEGLLGLGLPVAGGEPGPHLGSIVCVGELDTSGHDTTEDERVASLYSYLQDNGVVLTIRRGMLRMAFHLYNSADDVDQVIDLARSWKTRN